MMNSISPKSSVSPTSSQVLLQQTLSSTLNYSTAANFSQNISSKRQMTILGWDVFDFNINYNCKIHIRIDFMHMNLNVLYYLLYWFQYISWYFISINTLQHGNKYTDHKYFIFWRREYVHFYIIFFTKKKIGRQLPRNNTTIKIL